MCCLVVGWVFCAVGLFDALVLREVGLFLCWVWVSLGISGLLWVGVIYCLVRVVGGFGVGFDLRSFRDLGWLV